MSANLVIRLAGSLIVSSAAAQTSAPFDCAAFLKGMRVPDAVTLRDASGVLPDERKFSGIVARTLIHELTGSALFQTR